MEIKRYECWKTESGTTFDVADPVGKFVLYDDHKAKVESLQARIDQQLSVNADYMHIIKEHQQRITKQEARIAELEAAQVAPVATEVSDLIEWLLGENGDFPERPPKPVLGNLPQPLYWWRTELRARWNAILAEPSQPASKHSEGQAVTGTEGVGQCKSERNV